MLTCKVFTATKARDREDLGSKISDYMLANPTMKVVKTSVVQSSDAAYHCLTFVFFLEQDADR